MGWRREPTLAKARNGRARVLRPAGVGPPLPGEESPVPSHGGQRAASFTVLSSARRPRSLALARSMTKGVSTVRLIHF